MNKLINKISLLSLSLLMLLALGACSKSDGLENCCLPCPTMPCS